MRSLAMFFVCALMGFSSLAAAQGNGSGNRAASAECFCEIPASVPVHASAAAGLDQAGAGNAAGDRVVLGRDGRVVFLPGPACEALRLRFECQNVEDPVSP